MRVLKQSTATAVIIGPFLDVTDGFTPLTALAVASIDVDLYKQSDTHPLTKTDVTPAASGTSNDMAHVANGFYSLELTATDTNTLGRMRLSANIAAAVPLWEDFMVESDASISGSILTTALTEAYATDGAAPTLAQFAYMLWSALAERNVSGTTLTTKKLDGTTTAMTFTLDDSGTPTTQTRAT